MNSEGPSRQDAEREHFDRLATETGAVWWGGRTRAGRSRFERRARLIKAALSRFNDPFVVEIGCGTGAISELLLERLPDLRFLGTDISPKCVAIAAERCRDYKRAKFAVADSTKSEIEASSVDAVVGNAILHHIPLEESLVDFLRILRPGGIIWFAEPNLLNPQVFLEKKVSVLGRILDGSAHETAFSRWDLGNIVRNAGFEEVVAAPFDFLHPITPTPAISILDKLGRKIEKIPLLREIAGSIIIRARKPEF